MEQNMPIIIRRAPSTKAKEIFSSKNKKPKIVAKTICKG